MNHNFISDCLVAINKAKQAINIEDNRGVCNALRSNCYISIFPIEKAIKHVLGVHNLGNYITYVDEWLHRYSPEFRHFVSQCADKTQMPSAIRHGKVFARLAWLHNHSEFNTYREAMKQYRIAWLTQAENELRHTRNLASTS